MDGQEEQGTHGLSHKTAHSKYLLSCMREAGYAKPRDYSYSVASSAARAVMTPKVLDMALGLNLIAGEDNKLPRSTPYLQWYPFSARLLELISEGRWSERAADINKAGECWESLDRDVPARESVDHTGATQCRETLVVFAGGCTLSEIAAVRALSTPSDRFVVVTTGIITGLSFMECLEVDWRRAFNYTTH